MILRFKLTEEEYNKCRKFADESSKSQREYRSGGTQIRTVGQIFIDTLRGKVGEVIINKFLEQEPFNIQNIALDFGVYARGIWDETDIEINGRKLSIKSSKHFARWLLLEAKDIHRGDIYDYYILVLVDKNFKGGEVKGFASKEEVIEPDPDTLFLKKGELIPNTNTILDADNYARHSDNLHNSEEEWIELANSLKT